MGWLSASGATGGVAHGGNGTNGGTASGSNGGGGAAEATGGAVSASGGGFGLDDKDNIARATKVVNPAERFIPFELKLAD